MEKENFTQQETENRKTTQTHYFSLNFNNMSDTMFEIISKSKSKLARNYSLDLAWSYQFFCNYLKSICNRALEIQDKIQLFCFYQCGILTDVKDEEIKEWQKAYSEWKETQKSNEEVDRNE